MGGLIGVVFAVVTLSLSLSLSLCLRFIENNDIQALSKHTFRGLKSLTHLYVSPIPVVYKKLKWVSPCLEQ